MAAKLFPQDEKRRRSWARRLNKKLDSGRIEQLVAALRGIEVEDAELTHQLALEAEYFERNAKADALPRVFGAKDCLSARE